MAKPHIDQTGHPAIMGTFSIRADQRDAIRRIAFDVDRHGNMSQVVRDALDAHIANYEDVFRRIDRGESVQRVVRYE